MSKIDSGGPAFPSPDQITPPEGMTITTHPGMTLRQWYAGMAMQGMSSDYLAAYTDQDNNHFLIDQARASDEEIEDIVANACVNLADALIDAEKQDSTPGR